MVPNLRPVAQARVLQTLPSQLACSDALVGIPAPRVCGSGSGASPAPRPGSRAWWAPQGRAVRARLPRLPQGGLSCSGPSVSPDRLPAPVTQPVRPGQTPPTPWVGWRPLDILAPSVLRPTGPARPSRGAALPYSPQPWFWGGPEVGGVGRSTRQQAEGEGQPCQAQAREALPTEEAAAELRPGWPQALPWPVLSHPVPLQSSEGPVLRWGREGEERGPWRPREAGIQPWSLLCPRVGHVAQDPHNCEQDPASSVVMVTGRGSNFL